MEQQENENATSNTNDTTKSAFEAKNIDENPTENTSSIEEIKTIREVLTRFRQLSPDSNEFGCLKAIVLFAPGT